MVADLAAPRSARNYLGRNCGDTAPFAFSAASILQQWRPKMNTNATEVAELGFASPQHLPFVIGAAADLLLGLDLLVAGNFMAQWLAPGVQAVAGIPTGTILHGIGALLLGVAMATLAF